MNTDLDLKNLEKWEREKIELVSCVVFKQSFFKKL